MNLSAYDTLTKIDKRKTWLDVTKHQIISREIKYRNYYTIVKRYNSSATSYDYFIVLCNNKDEVNNFKIVKRDDFGRIKIKINTIWDNLNLSDITNDVNIKLNLVDEQEDGEIYELVI